MKIRTKVFTSLLCLLLPVWVFAMDVTLLKKFTLSQADEIIIEYAKSFVVTESDRVIVVDHKAANIKTFDMNGKRLTIFGRKGMGPNEFVNPLRIAYKDPYVAFLDYGREMTFMYKFSPPANFESVKNFLTLDGGFDFCFLDDASVLIAGNKAGDDGGAYHLYSYNHKKKKYNFILPSEVSFGLSSLKEYWKERKKKFNYIGLHHYCDVSDNSMYSIWKGDIKITKIDRKTGKIERFGMKSKKFVDPIVTPEIKQAYHRRDHLLLWKLDRQESAVKGIFVTKSNKVGVVYVGPFEADETFPVMLQLYTSKGDFIQEVKVMDAGSSNYNEIYFYFRKSDNRLYVLNTETSKDFDQSYRMHEFQVKE